MRRLWLWGPVVAYMAVIFYESSLTDAPLPGGMSDKLAHATGYALLGGLVARAMAGGFPLPLGPASAMTSLAMSVLYGASDEWHQRFVPGRTADLRDLLADAVGAAVAVSIVWACGILWPRLARRRAPSSDV
jgi:VanZ family protein